MSAPGRVSRLLRRLWLSPMVTTWANLGTRNLSLLILLPLVLVRLEAEAIAVYLYLTLLAGLQLVFSLGFNAVLVRGYGWALGGAEDLLPRHRGTHQAASNAAPNRALMRALWQTSGWLFRRLTFGFALFLVIGGGFLLYPLIQALEDPTSGWWAFGVAVTSITLLFWGGHYDVYLRGTNHIAVLNRWQSVFNLLALLVGWLVLTFSPNLLSLVIALNACYLLGLVRNLWLSRTVLDGWAQEQGPARCHRKTLGELWQPAWRSGIGMALSFGLVQLTGLAYGWVGSPAQAATVALALRLMQAVQQVAQAPFYSQLPRFNRWFAEGERALLLSHARRKMLLSHLAFVLPWAVLGAVGEILLGALGSNVAFPDRIFWALLGLGFLLQRYANMHLQLYSLSGHILWHRIQAINALIFAALLVPAIALLGIYALPLALLGSQLLYTAPATSRLSLRLFEHRWWAFERGALFPVLLGALCAALGMVLATGH